MRCLNLLEAILWIAVVLISPFFQATEATPTGATIILESNVSSAVVGEVIQLSGTVTPQIEGQKVYIHLNLGDSWQSVASGEAVNGVFAFSFKAESQGAHRFRAVVFSGDLMYQSEEVVVGFWPGSIFSRILIEDMRAEELSRLRSFKESLRTGSIADRSLYSAYVVVNSALSFLVGSFLWSVLRWFHYPALWTLQISRDVYMASSNAAVVLILYSLIFGVIYLSIPIFLIGYFSKIGLMPTRWKEILGIPTLVSACSLSLLVITPLPELGCIATLAAFASTALLPSMCLAKLINL